MSKETSKTAAETLDSFLSFLRRSLLYWKRATALFIVVALASIPGVFLKARSYRSETIVLWQETIRSTDITGNNEGGGDARRVGARLREVLLTRKSLEPIVNATPRYAALADRRSMIDAVDELRSHVTFKAREGDTFEVGYEGATAQEAQDVTRLLGDRIVGEASSRRAEQTKTTQQFMEKQSEDNKEKLRAADAALSAFLVLHPEFLPLTAINGAPRAIPSAGSPGTNPGGANAGGDPVRAGMENEARDLEAKLAGPAGSAPAQNVAPPRPPPESAEVQAARRDLADKLGSLTEQHPDVQAAKRHLAEAIAAQPPPPAPAPAPASGNEPKLSEAEREKMQKRLDSLRYAIAVRRMGGAPAPTATTAPHATAGAAASVVPGSAAVTAEVEFRRLQRDVEYLKEAQRHLDEKLFKADLAAGASFNDRNIQVKILDAAYLPTHASSKPRSQMLGMYLGAAFMLALLLALVSARLDDRIFDRADLEVLDIWPVVGVIPRSGNRKK